MADRTIKLMGKAYAPSGSVSLVVNWNGTEVHNGSVTTSTDTVPLKPADTDMVELASWTFSTDNVGSFPLSIAVSGGTLHFQQLEGNYVGYSATLDEFGAEVVTVQPDATWGDMNTNSASSDGKNSVSISNPDGDAQSRDINEASDGTGDWIYRIDDGATFSCLYEIEADKTVVL